MVILDQEGLLVSRPNRTGKNIDLQSKVSQQHTVLLWRSLSLLKPWGRGCIKLCTLNWKSKIEGNMKNISNYERKKRQISCLLMHDL
jgi:hypothetical protein